VVVTNAKKNWVHISAQRLLPLTNAILEESVPVISAREDHEEEFPSDAMSWK
jgi:hypothetical protein